MSALHAERVMFTLGADVERLHGASSWRRRRAATPASIRTRSPSAPTSTWAATATSTKARGLVRGGLTTFARFSVMHGKANGPVSDRDRAQLETLVSNYDMKQHTRADSRQAGTLDRRLRRPLRRRRSARPLHRPPAPAARRSASTRSPSAAAPAAPPPRMPPSAASWWRSTCCRRWRDDARRRPALRRVTRRPGDEGRPCGRAGRGLHLSRAALDRDVAGAVVARLSSTAHQPDIARSERQPCLGSSRPKLTRSKKEKVRRWQGAFSELHDVRGYDCLMLEAALASSHRRRSIAKRHDRAPSWEASMVLRGQSR